jgi:putative DNA primase/helicase
MTTHNRSEASYALPAAAAHNKATAKEYVAGLKSNAGKIAFQLISDGADRTRYPIVVVTLDAIWPYIRKFNTAARGLGVFVLPDWKGPPRDIFTAADNNGQTGSDSDLRVRLPGTLNLENPAAPQLVKLEEVHTHSYRGPDGDIPCTPTGREERGDDGQIYAEVRVWPDGTKSWPPKDRLAARDAADTAGRPAPPEPRRVQGSVPVTFLQKLRSGGPWVLTAITLDGKLPTVTAHTPDEVDAFVRRYNGRANLYYSVNPTRTAMSKKAKKTDIAAIEYILGDLDPAKGETSEAAKARYLKQLNGGGFEPRPTGAIDSGNGIQGLWRLNERIPLGEPVIDEEGKLVFSAEDQAKIDDAEARAAAVMRRLGAEAGTQNIDRILRLPGTTNLPNEKKRREGRVECQTRLLWFDDTSYPLEAFPKGEPDKKGPGKKKSNKKATDGDGPDLSGSGHGFRFMRDCHIRKMTYEEACTAILADKNEAGEWARRVDERQLERAWENSRPQGGEKHTDLGNARRLVRIHGDDICYVAAWKSWLVWRDGHWRRDDDGEIMRLAKAVVESMYTEAAGIADENARTALRKYALRCQSARALAAMVELAKTEKAVVLPVSMIDTDPLLLGVENGVVDLQTGLFRPAEREDYVTMRCSVAFDPSAKCPNWDAFLRRIFNIESQAVDIEAAKAMSTRLRAYIRRACGYTLTGLTDEEVMFILWNTGNNGKSTLRETIFALMGDYAMGADASLLIAQKNQKGGPTPDVARMYGKRLVTVNETQEGDQLNEARVKFITSHDITTARFLYENPFDFTPTHKTWLTTNKKPIIKGTDLGIWRRVEMWPFLVTIPEEERDRYFRQKYLMPELPGILNWVLRGLRKYHLLGLKPPPAVIAATQEYRDDMDVVGQWIKERLVRDPKSATKRTDLYMDYEIWSKVHIGWHLKAIAFGRELAQRKDLGLTETSVDRERGWRGVRLRSPTQYTLSGF